MSAERRFEMTTGDRELLRLLDLLLAHWRTILITIAVGGALAVAVSLVLEPWYRSTVLVSVAERGAAGGVNPGSFRYREAAIAIEAGFVLEADYSTEAEVMLGKLRSREFAAAFVRDGDLLPALFPDRWDPENERWIDGEEIPTDDDGAVYVTEAIRSVETDPETGMVRVSIDARSPATAAAWANRWVALFNEMTRVEAMEQAARYEGYLLDNLDRTSHVVVEQALYRIVEAQEQRSMLASVEEEFALEVVDPASPPLNPHRPRRRLLVVIGLIGGAVGGLAWVIGRDVWARVRGALETYRAEEEGA